MGRKTGRWRFGAASRALLVAAVIVSLAGVSAAKKPAPPPPDDGGTYTHEVVSLGTLGGDSHAYDVNASGEVCGSTLDGRYGFFLRPEDADGDGTPDRWFRDSDGDGTNDLMTPIPRLKDGGGIEPLALNDAGVVVGLSHSSETDPYGNPLWRAFVWTAAGGTVDLGTTPGYDCSDTRAINAAGMVAGYCYGATGTDGCGFVIVPKDTDGDGKPDTWFENDGSGHNALMRSLGAGNYAYGISPSGRICGAAGADAMLLDPVLNAAGELEWFRDDGTGGNTLVVRLPAPAGATGTQTWANAVNDAGEMAGGSYFDGGSHAVAWRSLADGSWLVADLGTAGEDRAAAVDVDAAGRILGNGLTVTYSRSKKSPGTIVQNTSFVWDGQDLKLLPDFVEGATNLQANGLNDAGLIVGQDQGTYRAILVRPK